MCLVSAMYCTLYPVYVSHDVFFLFTTGSIREPTQVFELLEAIFQSFDTIANRRGVFKVETV
jgi:hypothetical protein